MNVLACDRLALRRKCEALEGDLADYWRFFLLRCLRHPDKHPIDLAIAYLGSGRHEYLELFAEQFRLFVETLPSRDLTNQGQFHGWTNALPLTRWLLAYDLVADDDIFDAAFREQAARAWLGYAERLLWPVVRSRVQTGDNQFYAVCLGCAVIGHIFGRSRGESALGREMVAHALRRLADAVGQLPAGGYSGEGYYHNQVVATLATLHAAVMPALIGKDAFERALPPNGVSPRDILEVDYRTVMPGGLMVPWDASYFHPLHVKMNLVYLARMTGKPEYLRPIKRYRLFEADPRPGWGRDDDAWTWLWWPDDIRSFDQVPGDAMPSWARQHVAFGLVEPDAETGLFQNFDISERADSPSASRVQSDPNNIVLVGHGTPLILDGGYAKLEDEGPASVRRGRTGVTGFGFHNCLSFQGEDAAGVVEATAGRLTCFFRSPLMSLGEADVTAHYAAYGVSRVRRRTLQLGEGLYLVADDISADRPVDVSWNLWTRPYAREENGRILVDTPEQVRLTIVLPQGRLLPIQRVEGVPAILENAASRIRVQAHGSEIRMRSVLHVARLTEDLADLSSGWEVVTDGASGTVDTLRGLGVQRTESEPLPLPQRFIWDYMDRREQWPAGRRYDAIDFGRGVRLRRSIQIPPDAAGKHLFIRLERPPWYFRFFVDGRQVAGHGMSHPAGLGDGNHVAPGLIDIAAGAETVRSVELVLEIAEPYASTAVGAVTLVASRVSAPLTCEQEGGWWFLSDASRKLAVLPANPTHDLLRMASGATDAESAVFRQDGAWAVVGATTLEMDGRTVIRCRYGRVSAAWQNGQLTIHDLGENAICEFHLPEGRVVVHGGQDWEGLAILASPLSVEVPVGEGLPVIRWMQPGSTQRAGETSVSFLVPATGSAERLERLRGGDAHARGEAVAELAATADGAVVAALRQALREDRCWTVRCTAARVLGERMAREAVSDLLAVLAAEQARDVYSGVTDQNDFPQWPGGSNGDPLKDFGNLPLAVCEMSEPGTPPEFANRFRLKQAVVEALGLIGDPIALNAVAGILEPPKGTEGLGMTGGDFYPVRKAAAEALGRMGDPAALHVLRQVAETEVEINARYAAQQAVAWLTVRAVPNVFR